jgi:Protein of unknown function (DUF3176)
MNESHGYKQILRKPVPEAKELMLKPPTQSRIQQMKPWWSEGLACLGVLMGLVAIFVTLDKYKNKPLPQLPFKVSINTVVSLEATVLKGCLTFVVGSIISQSQWLWFTSNRSLYDIVRYDDAARGPWGSALWIWEHHIRSPLTSFGAIVMILTLLVDPFVQELISYAGCQTEMKGPLQRATIPRTNYYLSPFYHLGIGAVDIKIPTPVQNAIFAGVERTPTNIPFDCYTGNFTFSVAYSTAGYCHHCEDISSLVQLNETCYSPGNSCYAVNITSQLPDGFLITSSSWGAIIGDDSSIKTPVMAMRPTNDSFVEFLVAKTVRSGCDPSPGNNTWTCQGYGAAKCMLGPCVRTYNASINNNIITEYLLDNSDPQLAWGGSMNPTGILGDSSEHFVNGLVDLRCVTEDDRQKLLAQNYTFNSTTRWLPYSFSYDSNATMTQNPPFPGSMLANGCVYLSDEFFEMSLWDVFLYDFYTGTLLGTVQDSDQLISVDGPRLLEITYDNANGSFSTIDSTFASMATYLTNYIRQNGHPLASQPAQGTTMHYATCVQVNWRWLAYPSILAGIALALFIRIVSVVTNSRSRIPLWKSSPLAFMFRGPSGGDLQSNIGEFDDATGKMYPDTLKHLETISKRTVVKLGRSNEVLRLENNTTDQSTKTTRMSRTRFDWIKRLTSDGQH